MRHISRPTTLLLFLAIFSASCHANKLAELLLKRVEPYTYEVLGKAGKKEARSSGIMISPFGHILTSTSAIQGAEVIKIRRPGKTFYEKARFVMTDNYSNMAIIVISGAKGLPFIHIKGFTPYKTGTTYMAIAFADKKTKKVDASIGKLGAKLDIVQLAGSSSADGHGKVFPEMVPFPGNCTGGAVLDEKGRLLGMANYVITKDKKAKCFLVPMRKIGSYLLSLFVPEALEVLKEKNKGFTTVRTGLGKCLREVGNNLKGQDRIAFENEVKAEVVRFHRFSKMLKAAAAKKRAADEPKFKTLPKKGQDLHRQYPTWSYEHIKGICDKQLVKGMTKKMVKMLRGEPLRTHVESRDGHSLETWLYVDVYDAGIRKQAWRTRLLFVDGMFVKVE